METDDRTGGPDPATVRAALRRLAGASPEAVVERAAAAVGDIDLAVAFVEDVGLDGLEAAVVEVDDETLAARGERALAVLRRYRAAAAGEDEGAPAGGDGNVDEGDVPACGRESATGDGPDVGHFHRGRGTDLRSDGEPTSR